MDEAKRCLSFVKGAHRFVFWYRPGQESELLASFLEYAERPDVDFDWFDAAVLSYQMGKGSHAPEAAARDASRGGYENR